MLIDNNMRSTGDEKWQEKFNQWKEDKDGQEQRSAREGKEEIEETQTN